MVKNNVLTMCASVAEACRVSGRKPEAVTLVAVTKFARIEAIQEAVDAGIKHIAENRVQEAQAKFPAVLAQNPALKTHLIGHLQTNKAKDVLKIVALIQSVDSLKLAQEIEKQAAKVEKPVDILVQFNTAREEQKFGAQPERAYELMESIIGLAHVRIKGLMAMAPFTEDAGVIRKAFADLRELRDGIRQRFEGKANVSMDVLSMGMSGDYKIAIEEGSTMVRVGSAIFKAEYAKT